MHPEKMAGIEEQTTSFQFPLKLKGNKADVENMIKQTLAGKDKNKELALAKAKAMRMKLDLLSLNGLDTSGLETINIEFNKQLINYKKNILYKRYVFNLGKTPKYLIEKGLPNTTVKMKQKVLKKKLIKSTIYYYLILLICLKCLMK